MSYDHNEIIEADFKKRCPWFISDIERIIPRGDNSLTAVLRDGTRVHYNADNFSYRVDDGRRPAIFTDDYCRQDFSFRLADMMKRRGYTQKTLAEDIGVSQNTMSKYMRQQATPSITVLQNIVKTLNCDYHDLLG